MTIKLQHSLFVTLFTLVLGAIAQPAEAQYPPPDQPPPPVAMPPQGAPPPILLVRICDETGCSLRPKDAVSTETVNDDADRESPGVARLRQLAETSPKAAYDLGLRYFRGAGVRQDSYQALVWMRKAGEQGNLRAQKALGGFYLYGLEEMGPDPQEAEKWLSMAVAQGDKASKKLLSKARTAKKADQADFKQREREDERDRMMFSNYWSSGYPYYGVWQQTYWYGY